MTRYHGQRMAGPQTRRADMAAAVALATWDEGKERPWRVSCSGIPEMRMAGEVR